MGSIQSLLLTPLLCLWEETDAIKTSCKLLGMEEPEAVLLEQQIRSYAAEEGIRFGSMRDIQLLKDRGWKGRALSFECGSWTGQKNGTSYASSDAKTVLGWLRGEGRTNVHH